MGKPEWIVVTDRYTKMPDGRIEWRRRIGNRGDEPFKLVTPNAPVIIFDANVTWVQTKERIHMSELQNEVAAMENAGEKLAQIIHNLTTNRLVHYVMKDGTRRPLLVLWHDKETDAATGVLFFHPSDQANANFPGDQIHESQGVKQLCCGIVDEAPCGTTAGCWTMPERVGDATPLTPATFVPSLEEFDQKLQNFLEGVVTPKLKETVSVIETQLDSHSAVMTGALDRVTAAKGELEKFVEEAKKSLSAHLEEAKDVPANTTPRA